MEKQKVVVAGVDTHKDIHVLCVLDDLGQKINEGSFKADVNGYAELARAIGSPDSCIAVGVEGTSSYGAGLTAHLIALGFTVYEVLRPKRDKRRIGTDKNDSVDAERAARNVLAGNELSIPKSQDGWVGSLRFLWASRKTAIQASTSAMNAVKGLLASAPESIRLQFPEGNPHEMMSTLSRTRSRDDIVEDGAIAGLRSLARLWLEAKQQAESLSIRIRTLLEEHAPALLGVYGCGTSSAAALAVAAGDNPERMQNEASFAALCGVSPIEASSGKTIRHRLNRGGNRQANCALYRIAVVRMRYDEKTKAYVQKRLQCGKSIKEIIRCLKRYIAREIYHTLLNPMNSTVQCKAFSLTRKYLGLSQAEIAISLNVSAATISNIERGVYRNNDLEERYSKLLNGLDKSHVICT